MLAQTLEARVNRAKVNLRNTAPQESCCFSLLLVSCVQLELEGIWKDMDRICPYNDSRVYVFKKRNKNHTGQKCGTLMWTGWNYTLLIFPPFEDLALCVHSHYHMNQWFEKNPKPNILIRIQLCFTSPSSEVTRASSFHSSHCWQHRLSSSKTVCLVQTQGPYLEWALMSPDRPHVQLHLALPSEPGFIAESQREQRK